MGQSIRTFVWLIALVTGLGVAGIAGLVLDWRGLRALAGWERPAARWLAGLLAGQCLCLLWGWQVEPRLLSETRLTVEVPGLPAGQRVRLVHLTDLHVDGPTPLLDRLAVRINALRPDALVLTGDLVHEQEGIEPLQRMLRSVQARYGTFAVLGNQDLGGVLHGIARELDGSGAQLGPLPITFCGEPYGKGSRLPKCLRESHGVRVVLFHTPDLVEDLAPSRPDLYLAGHTHGGQVRLPFYGALLTLSKFGKRYEMGRYQVGGTTLFVSRGIGMEGSPAPQVRFLCPPEIGVIDLVGTGQAAAP